MTVLSFTVRNLDFGLRVFKRNSNASLRNDLDDFLLYDELLEPLATEREAAEYATHVAHD